MMKHPVYFQELTGYSKQDFIERLSLSHSAYEELEEFLLTQSFLQMNQQNKLQFHFVGAIYFQQHLLIVCPKYMDSTVTSVRDTSIAQLLQVILKFIKSNNQHKTTKLETHGLTKLETDCSHFVLVDFLMQDYLAHGFYLPDYADLELNGTGEIDWPTTIELNHVIFQQGKPIYIDYYTSTTYWDESNIIHQIHQAILQEISLFFEQFSVLNLFQYPTIQTNYLLEELGDVDDLIQLLNKEMQVVFSDQKLSLLQALITYLEQKKQRLLYEEIQLFGISAFHVVWEKVCSQVFDNQYEHFKKWIPKPQWTELYSGKVAEVATLIPDILIYRQKENAFYIIDAKYYTTYFEEIDEHSIAIRNNPSVGDVTKQYLYEQTLRKHNLEVPATTQYYNLFVFPTEENSHFFGHVTFDIFTEDFKGIYLYRQNAPQLFHCYLNNLNLPTKTLQVSINNLS